jgi:hypothetical protein
MVQKKTKLVMEGFMESFIYLLITIVILVLSMRKRKPAQPVSEEETPPGDPFSELFNDENDEDYGPEIQPSTVSGQQSDGSGQPNPWMTETEAQDMLMDADAIMKEAAENNLIAELEGKVEGDAYSIDIDEDKEIPFDLRKAVIYSEILGRRTI